MPRKTIYGDERFGQDPFRDSAAVVEEEPVAEVETTEQPGAMPMAQQATAAAGTQTEEAPSKLAYITQDDVREAAKTLAEYKNGKANLEIRIIEDEQWYKQQHWNLVNASKSSEELKRMNVKTTSAWLFNTIANKHADMMDNYPEPIVLPRERSDEESAKVLSSVLPVVMEQNKFPKVYSKASWDKIKTGTTPYGVFWNSEKYNGLGDIDIRQIDLLNIFWEPGIEDIQKSRNLFIVELVDTDLLEQEYPDLEGKLNGSIIDISKYVYDDSIDTSKKSVVVDWYYKRKMPSGKVALHYVKFVGDEILFASENEPEYSENGFYNHGKYPVVMDVMFPEKGTPCGFGFVSICKNPQIYIDALSSNMLEASRMGTKKRFFVSNSANINEEEFKDWDKPIIHVEGAIDDSKLQEVKMNQIGGSYQNILQMKIDEMKETAFNRDVTSGGSSSGITAASAIAALQEAGNKQSRDTIQEGYMAFTEICELCIELMRQFYDTPRTFRILGNAPGEYQFQDISNAMLAEQVTGVDALGNEFYRVPVFDLKIKAQKRNPFSRMESNERAQQLYSMGFFNPERAQEALVALEMMEFEGKEKLVEQVQQGQTLLSIVQQQSQLLAQITGMMAPMPGAEGGGMLQSQQEAPRSDITNSETSGIMQSRAPMTPYGQRLAKRSAPDLNQNNDAAAVGR